VNNYKKVFVVDANNVAGEALMSKFTIPNITSRLSGYWAFGLPILAVTDLSANWNESFFISASGRRLCANG
jgi:hypothetical protein